MLGVSLAPAATVTKAIFDLPADLAEKSLRLFSRQSGAEVVFASSITKGVRTQAVKGEMPVRQALDAMLKGTGLVVFEDKSGAFSIKRDAPEPNDTAQTPKTGEAQNAPKEKELLKPQTERMKRNNLFTRLAAIVTLMISAPANAQDTPEGTGIIEGRVLNSTNGNYLNNARVTIDGTNVEAFTNNFGEYRLTNVPAGSVKVRATYTGLVPESATVTVSSGARANRDFSLTRGTTDPQYGIGETVMLDAFVTAASKEMSGREIALNEQRYSANLKNVVSADEFGDIADGNIGEFLKFIPGLTIDPLGADAWKVSVRGLPPDATAMMADGAPMASAASATPSRAFELEQVSINNISRIEVTKSPTPDLPANAVGGSVNMVSRSAFERSKPLFTYRTYINWNADQGFFEKTSGGPSRESSVHTNPSFDFSYIRPVNKNFGFTVSAYYSDTYNADYRAQPSWVPSVTGSALAPADNPFMRNYTNFYGPKVTRRMALSTTLDWRISDRNVLTFGAQWNNYDAFFNNKTADMNTLGTINNQAPAAWGPTFTQSQPGAASMDRGAFLFRKYGTTGHFSLKFVHDGPVWQFDAGATYSKSTNHHRNPEKGFVNSYSMVLRNLTLRLDDIDPEIGVPRVVTATNANGSPVDWKRLGPYRLNQIVLNEQDSHDVMTSARLNAKREFKLPFVEAPFAVKTGVDIRRMNRDIRDHNRTRYNFVGPDGSNAATSTDDLAGHYDLVDHGFHQDGGSYYGEPWFEYASPYKLYDLFTAHPAYFVEDVPFRIQQHAQDSMKLTETVSAAYLRTDWRFFNNRLWIVGGVRYERTDDDGYGVLNDPTAKYQKNASGELIRGANGLPILIPGLSSAHAAALQFTERGAHSKREYDGFFPSANVVFNLTPNLLLRASYAQTISRPNLSEIIPGMTISEPNTTNENNLLIRVNNTGLNPWTAENVDLGLEYYFGRSGGNVISIGGFQKDIKDFFATRREDTTPELLESFGLDDTYLVYDLQYKFNAGDATVTGLELNYRHGLTFLPHWARGMDVFYNMTSQRLQGTTLADFSNFIRRNDNYGVTLSRPKFTVRLKVNDRGRQRQSAVTGANVAPGTYRYNVPKRTLDIDFEYRIRPALSFFVAGRNVTNAPSNHQEVYGDGTPEYARISRYWEHGVNYVIGFKGSF
jgi:iron complex outermembrane recepter protein